MKTAPLDVGGDVFHEVAAARNAWRTGRMPRAPDARKLYFVAQISMGEVLSERGRHSYVSSAGAFFRAIKAHPVPLEELTGLMDKPLPTGVDELILKMMEIDSQIDARLRAFHEGRLCAPRRTMVEMPRAASTSTSGQDKGMADLYLPGSQLHTLDLDSLD